MASPNLTELITTTLRKRSDTIADNVSNKNALMRRMKRKGNIEKLDGGRTIVEPIFYAENGTFKRYSGAETLDTSASDVISAAEYEWKQAAVNVFIHGLERRQNSGSSQLFSLLKQRIKNAEMTFENNLSSDMYSAGTSDGGKQIGGLQLLIADDPTTGTVGGIDRSVSANSFWRNYGYSALSDGGAAASAANILSYMDTVWINTQRQGDKVDLILADNNYWLHYLNSMQAIQRVRAVTDADPGTGGDDGALKYFSADVLPDGGSGIPSNHMYFVNTNYLHFKVHKDAFMSPSEERMSINQDASIVPILFMGNLTMSNAARQASLND